MAASPGTGAPSLRSSTAGSSSTATTLSAWSWPHRTALARKLSEPRVDHRLPGGMRSGVSGDCGKEVGALEGVQMRVDPRSDGRRSRHVSEQRDLAEVVAAARGLVEVVDLDVELAVADDVEAISYVSRVHDLL